MRMFFEMFREVNQDIIIKHTDYDNYEKLINFDK